jgi:hypothetical protein
MKRTLGSLLVVAILMLGYSAAANASHQLGGNISWQRDTTFVSATQTRFKLHVELVLRWSFFSVTPPAIGSQVTGEPVVFTFDPNQSVTVPPLTVQTVYFGTGPKPDPKLNDDWMVATGDVTITVLTAALPLTVSYQDCCRNTLLADGNADRTFRLETVVTNALNATRSPRSTATPRIYGEVGQLLDFQVPVIDADGLVPTTVRLATTTESGLSAPAPQDLTLFTTGRVRWTPTATGIYAMQVAVQSSSGAKVPVDLVFDIKPAAPHLAFAPGLCGTNVDVRPGIEARVPISVTSPIPGDPVTLSYTPLPPGGLILGSGSDYSFIFTPPLDQVASNVCFSASSASGATTVGSCCLTTQLFVPPHVCGLEDGVSVLPPNYAAASTFLGTSSLASGDQLQLMSLGQSGSATGAAWLAGARQPIGNGFSFRFTITTNQAGPPSPSEGFAFVIQNSGPTALGGAGFDASGAFIGGGLGYDGIDHSLAIEFDNHSDSAQSDPTFKQIAVHSRYSAPNSAQESTFGGALIGGSIRDNNLPLNFDNGTTQDIRIDYRPADPGQGSGGGAALGSLKVYVNKNVAPIVQTQIDDAALANALGPTPFFGFTTSKDPSTDQKILISNVKLISSVGASGRLLTAPGAATPGVMSQFLVQALDQCGVAMRYGGDTDQWGITVTDGSTQLPAEVVDNGDGTYSVRYTPPTAGTWHASVTFAGAAIPGGPVDINVVAPTLAPPGITAPVSGYTSTDHDVAVAGTGAEGATVLIYDGTSIVGTTQVSGGTFTTVIALPEGAHFLSAVQSLGGASSDPSSSVPLHIRPVAPVITSPADGTVGASPALMITGTATPGATLGGFKGVNGLPATQVPDLVIGPEGTFSIPLAPLREGGGLYTVMLTQTINDETSAPAVVHVTMPDFPPALSNVPGDIAAEATGPGTPITWPPVTATDPELGPLFAGCGPASGSLFPAGTTVVNCGTTDHGLHTTTAHFKVTINDTRPPVFGPVSDVVVEATGPDGAAVTLSPVATDLVDGVVTPACVPASGSTFAMGATSVSCTATDKHNNASSAPPFTVTVRDTTPPELAVGADVTVEATSSSGATVTYAAPTAHDLVGGDLSGAVRCSPASGATFALGATIVSCTVADPAGNTASGGFKVAVFDSTGPVFSAPPDLTIEASTASGAAVGYVVTPATDAVDGPVPVTCLPASGSLFPLGETVVQCIASDVPGNVTTKAFKVLVVDTTAPQLAAVSGDLIVQATGPAGAVVAYATPTATDAVDGPLPVSCAPPSGAVFGLGVNVVLCQAADSHGNVRSAPFRITVIDTTPPLLVLPGPLTAEATGPAGAAVTFAVGATDIVSGAALVQCSASSGDTFPIGQTAVQCTASDLNGNVSTGGFTVLVKDTAAPAISGVPAGQTVLATSAAGAAVTYAQPTAADVVDGAVAVQCTPASGATFPLGATTVTCGAQDAAGNAASATFVVTVRDDRGPVFGPTPSPTAYATSTAGAIVSYVLPKAVDDVDGQRPVTCTPASGSKFKPGSTTVTCKASDTTGHIASVTFNVKVTYQAPADGSFFKQPINGNGSSIFKLGSTVPVKFALTGASAGITNLVAKLSVVKAANGIEGTLLEATDACGADSGSTFRYSGGQYIFNLSTKSLSKGTWVIKADLGDGVDHSVRISLR